MVRTIFTLAEFAASDKMHPDQVNDNSQLLTTLSSFEIDQ